MRGQSSFADSVSKKAFEIAYALFRVAAYAPKKSFAGSLEDQAVSILKSATAEDYLILQRAIYMTYYLMRLGADINLLSQQNAQVIGNELEKLNSAIADYENTASLPDFELKGIFTEMTAHKRRQKSAMRAETRKSAREGLVEAKELPTEEANVASRIRQSAILERIRQIGNCRLAEMHTFFPAISERTLRYDLQTLIERGLLERIGDRGPATSYRVRDRQPIAESRVVEEGTEYPITEVIQ